MFGVLPGSSSHPVLRVSPRPEWGQRWERRRSERSKREEKVMELTKVRVADIKPYPNNPRRNDEAVAAVAESIRQCGYCAPIVVDENMVILAGHTRHRALEQLGWVGL